MNNFYLALLHYPVYNKYREIVTTSITNLDIHDISRSCKTFAVKEFHIVTPLSSQKDMLLRILGFWKKKEAQSFNPFRNSALSITKCTTSLEDTVQHILSQEKNDPVLVSTTAVKRNDQINFDHLKKVLLNLPNPVLLIFGTGNGLTEETLTCSDYILQPVTGCSDYNHLSVRSAVAIILDRLLSEK